MKEHTERLSLMVSTPSDTSWARNAEEEAVAEPSNVAGSSARLFIREMATAVKADSISLTSAFLREWESACEIR